MGNADQTKVLVVDDDLGLRELIAFDFEEAGFEVYQAEGGTQALEQIKKQTVHAVVSDIRMKGLDGRGLLKELRAQYGALKPIVVLITGFADLHPEEAFALGADGYFEKPFGRRVVVSAVQRLLTPQAERWTSPIAAKTRRKVEWPKSESIVMGRGGFMARGLPEVLRVKEELEFKISLGSETIQGIGLVRWASPEGTPLPEARAGIEFLHLSSENIAALAKAPSQGASGIAYIPNG